MEEPGQASSQQQDPKTKRILANHRRLKKILSHIAEGTEYGELPTQLAELGVVLADHFHDEEGDDGLFEVVDERAPQCHATIEKLRQEHRALTDELAELCETARSGSEDDHARTQERAMGFVTRLKDHEERETRLFLDSWCTDLGEMD